MLEQEDRQQLRKPFHTENYVEEETALGCSRHGHGLCFGLGAPQRSLCEQATFALRPA